MGSHSLARRVGEGLTVQLKESSADFLHFSQVHLKSAVVHETHSNRDKLHHVSKVYFYSVSSTNSD